MEQSQKWKEEVINMKNDVAIIIPAYNPDTNLIELIKKLKESLYSNIIVVNDGSDSTEIFESIKDKAIILLHDRNYGKGQALKTGFKWCIDNMKEISGAITVDADGQHRIEDIDNVYNNFEKNKDSLVLGCREFKGDKIPLKSKFGNKLISYMIYKKTKIKLNDTQTGLRAIPRKCFDESLKIVGNGFEYETNMLLNFIQHNINIVEIKIESIYINKNKSSHYRPIMDSIKVGKTLLDYKW